MAGMEKKLGLTDKKVKTVQESRKPSFTEMRYKTRENSSERQHTGNASKAAQDRILSSRDRDIKSNASMVSTGGRQKLRQRSSQENRRSGGVTSNPSESPRHWPQEQSNKVKSRPYTSKLGQLKGGGRGNELNKKEETSSQQDETFVFTVAQTSTGKLAFQMNDTGWYSLEGV